MTSRLQHLLREEAERLDVPPPPIDAILADGQRRRRGTRARGALAVAAAAAVVAGVLVGGAQLVTDDRPSGSLPPASTPSSAPTTEPRILDGPLEVSGSGVGAQPFGADADEVVAAVTARFGEPDRTVGPQRYSRIPGQDGWFEVADDPISPSWAYPVVSVTCWQSLCLVFGGEDPDSLKLRGWELARFQRWSGSEQQEPQEPDVRLAGSGIRLGDSWKSLHAAYPHTVVAGSEGASLAVKNTPWATVSDGAAGWRLSGVWDYAHPNRVPKGAVVTRLSAGEGPEPGCC